MDRDVSLSPENLDPGSKDFGVRDEKGHWRPPYPCKYTAAVCLAATDRGRS